MNKYDKIIEKIKGGGFSREELRSLEDNAKKKYREGDFFAQAVIDAIGKSAPTNKHIIFMGFCPGADFANRKDIEWKEKSICTFYFYDSDQQLERFNSVCVGDLIVLKKRHEFGKTMKLYGYGRVNEIKYDDKGDRFLGMKWSSQNNVIEVPLMGCNSTVDVRAVDRVEREAPEIFEWLKEE